MANSRRDNLFKSQITLFTVNCKREVSLFTLRLNKNNFFTGLNTLHSLKASYNLISAIGYKFIYVRLIIVCSVWTVKSSSAVKVMSAERKLNSYVIIAVSLKAVCIEGCRCSLIKSYIGYNSNFKTLLFKFVCNACKFVSCRINAKH